MASSPQQRGPAPRDPRAYALPGALPMLAKAFADRTAYPHHAAAGRPLEQDTRRIRIELVPECPGSIAPEDISGAISEPYHHTLTGSSPWTKRPRAVLTRMP